VDVIDMDDIHQPSLPLGLSAERRELLDHLWLCHERGPGYTIKSTYRVRVVVFFVACCVGICAGLVIFGNQISPFCSVFASGFIVGILFTVFRRQQSFQRYWWPLFESIIDWKLVERLRKNSDMLCDHNASQEAVFHE